MYVASNLYTGVPPYLRIISSKTYRDYMKPRIIPNAMYLLHGADSFLRSWPVFAASQEIPRIFMEPESSLPYSQVPATCPYPEPTPPNLHDPLQLPEDPS
jgi:hypothetical protein